jgi:hypothetical protein
MPAFESDWHRILHHVWRHPCKSFSDRMRSVARVAQGWMAGILPTLFLRQLCFDPSWDLQRMGTWQLSCVPTTGKCCKNKSVQSLSKSEGEKTSTPIRARPFFPHPSDCPSNAPWAAAAEGPSVVVPSPSPSKALWRTAALDAASISFALPAFWQELPVGAPCDASVHQE